MSTCAGDGWASIQAAGWPKSAVQAFRIVNNTLGLANPKFFGRGVPSLVSRSCPDQYRYCVPFSTATWEYGVLSMEVNSLYQYGLSLLTYQIESSASNTTVKVVPAPLPFSPLPAAAARMSWYPPVPQGGKA